GGVRSRGETEQRREICGLDIAFIDESPLQSDASRSNPVSPGVGGGRPGHRAASSWTTVRAHPILAAVPAGGRQNTSATAIVVRTLGAVQLELALALARCRPPACPDDPD